MRRPGVPHPPAVGRPRLTHYDGVPGAHVLAASFDELAGSASVGIAIAAPGQTEVYTLGRWSTGVAWSTAKVPLAIAALRADRARAKTLVAKAITESDNPASEHLWSLLGEPACAAGRVQAVIVQAGDASTVVESRRLRPGFTAFGQTQWSLALQARFAANLSDIPEAAPVIELMHRIMPEQRWGLAAKGVAAKGGWGPGVGGGYLTRQFGIVPVPTGHLGVALAADARTFEAGVAVLNQLVDWLFGHLAELPH
ncbi:MAG: hypothetical protein QOG19_2831 [Mycobacterium sp.]|nr:hypothetical protein [Mycobacterium sp.]